MAFVPLFAPSLSAAEVVLSVMLVDVDGACVDEIPGSCSERGPVDLGMKIDV
jgi:hypothetical protein